MMNPKPFTSDDIPDVLYDANGMAYKVKRPMTADSDGWVIVTPVPGAPRKIVTSANPVPTKATS